MQFHEFIGKVQHLASLPSEDQALKVTRVTLETLAMRIAGGEPKHIASQLPEEIGRFLSTSEGAETVESFTLNDFYNRVAERTGADEPAARHYARSVMAVMREAVSKGEMDDLKDQLPDEFEPLLNPPESSQM